jgi:hypothetical protein
MDHLIVRFLLITALSIVTSGGPALSDCVSRYKANECNSRGGDADDYRGCSVEATDSWYNIRIWNGKLESEKVCDKNPPSGYCACAVYGIY